VKTDIVGNITDADISRSIEAASTLTVTVNDYDRALLTSGLLSNALDVQIDGLWFRLAGVDKSGDSLTLTFEDREIAILRNYNKWKIARRSKHTRAEFVLNLIREVKEFKIPVVIPELHRVMPIERWSGDVVGAEVDYQKGKGFPKDAYAPIPDTTPGQVRAELEKRRLTVKGVVANKTQLATASSIIGVGQSMNARRKVQVSAIMTSIQESTLGVDLENPSSDARGPFQQMPWWGSLEDRMDPETSAKMYYNKAIPEDQKRPDEELYLLCENVQASGHPTYYAKWRTEAEKFVTAYGTPGSTVETPAAGANGSATNISQSGEYYFYRGAFDEHGKQKIRKKENSWSCIQRLADEVDYRAFFVSGTFYWISEDQLFKQRPQFNLTEFTDGILGIDGEYHMGKGNGSITISARAGRWLAPPGCVVVMQNMGPWNGRWLVTEFNRSLFDLNASITLKKPQPVLPEPDPQGNEEDIKNWLPKNATAGTAVPVPTNADTYPTTGFNLRNTILNDPKIQWNKPDIQRNDIKSGLISDAVMQFMVWLANNNYTYIVTALRSDHSTYTTGGNVSAHSAGRAIDIGSVNGTLMAPNGVTAALMDVLAANQKMLGFAQLIGPFSQKVIPLGWYDSATLDQHKNHIHVGWSI